jgi:hypothetical protein
MRASAAIERQEPCGNNKTLKEWKAKYGSDTVESWLSK